MKTPIGESAFEGCTSLESVTVSYSVTRIYNCAFSGCTSLKSMNIPDSVIWIGENVFYECAYDLVITYMGKTYTKDSFNELSNM